ncbi:MULTISPECIES: MarR family winged helix-turn-helix transcriptional regulator [Actinokineospora]|nr:MULTISPECIES: MarR family transcriptional regulator [Actinokineospora]UVS76497.1 Multiple antibiotic resistance protein MarR [Actinokineospora sp. UTMC 2448]
MRDQVDDILEQWRRERPDLDVAPMGLFGRLTRLAAVVSRELEANFARHGLTGADFDVLATLRRAGAPHTLTVGRLQATMMISSGATTHRIDRLERRGLVARDPDPQDRRGVRVRLTDEGRALVDEAVATHLALEHALVADIPPARRDALTDLLRELLVSLSAPRNLVR